MTLWSLKGMGRLVVKLKTIKYNKDFFCYLSSYTPDLGFQTLCLLTLFFRPYAFRTLYPQWNTFIYSSLGSQIRSNNLNSHLLSLLLTQWSTSHNDWVDQTLESHTCYVQRVICLTTHMIVQKT